MISSKQRCHYILCNMKIIVPCMSQLVWKQMNLSNFYSIVMKCNILQMYGSVYIEICHMIAGGKIYQKNGNNVIRQHVSSFTETLNTINNLRYRNLRYHGFEKRSLNCIWHCQHWNFTLIQNLYSTILRLDYLVGGLKCSGQNKHGACRWINHTPNKWDDVTYTNFLLSSSWSA